MRDLYRAQGFLLQTKAAGWKRFCERLGFQPFGLWQYLPGCKRLQRALQLLEDTEYRQGAAFDSAAMLRWLLRVRSPGKPLPTAETLLSPEHFANDLDETFRLRVKWWGG
jgi:hypothetical protein